MDITHTNIYGGVGRSRSRSRSRTRNSTANSRSTSATRRPSFGLKRSLSSSSLNKLQITPSPIEFKDRDKAVPSVNATLDNTLPLDFFKQDIISLVKTLRISKWHKKSLHISNLFVNRISGALTNSIYKIEYKDHQQNLHLPALLLRVYGKNVDSLIDRELELEILIKLSAKKIGPKLLGIFTNGRFEQFLEGFITLNKDQIKDDVLSQILGRRMKDLHYRIKLEPKDLESDLPMCWRLINKWMGIFETTILPQMKQHNNDAKDTFLVDFDKFKKLVSSYKEWLFNHYDNDKPISQNYKFCHNDTQYGNLLLHESFDRNEVIANEDGDVSVFDDEPNSNPVVINTSNKKDSSLVVIDFEYSGPNFPAYDIADHFSEWMADYHDPERSYYIFEEKYPTQLEILNLIKSYVEYDFQYPSSTLKTKTQFSQNLPNATDLIQFEIKKLYNECILWRTSVQIYWCLWGLIQGGPLIFASSVNVDELGLKSEEMGVDGIYNISTGLDAVNIDENVTIEEAVSSTDDDFDYMGYSQQKAALIIGDLIEFGLVEESEIDPKFHGIIKRLECNFYDI